MVSRVLKIEELITQQKASINGWCPPYCSVAEVLQKNDTARANARRVLDSLIPAIREKVKQ